MGIADLRKQQADAAKFKQSYVEALKTLNEKLEYFESQAIPAIFEQVRTQTKGLEINCSSELRREAYNGYLMVVYAAIAVPGTNIRLEVSNQRYSSTRASKETGMISFCDKSYDE